MSKLYQQPIPRSGIQCQSPCHKADQKKLGFASGSCQASLFVSLQSCCMRFMTISNERTWVFKRCKEPFAPAVSSSIAFGWNTIEVDQRFYDDEKKTPERLMFSLRGRNSARSRAVEISKPWVSQRATPTRSCPLQKKKKNTKINILKICEKTYRD